MKSITVVTLLTDAKAYCLRELLQHFAALAAPAGHQVRFLVIVAGELAPEREALLSEFATAGRAVDVQRGPEIVAYAGDTYWRSMTAGELRERARKVLARRRDAWVLWVDCDVLPPAETLPRLLAHNRPLASGLVLNRLQGSPIAGKKRWDPETEMPPEAAWDLVPGVQEVWWTGFGLLLCRGDLAREISFAPYLRGQVPNWTGEDGYFCMEATARSREGVLLDADLCPWHVDSTSLALRAVWEWWSGNPGGAHLVRSLSLIGDTGPARCCLIPRVTGRNPFLGELVAGRPLWTDATGRELSDVEMRALAAGSRVLDLLEPGRETRAD